MTPVTLKWCSSVSKVGCKRLIAPFVGKHRSKLEVSLWQLQNFLELDQAVFVLVQDHQCLPAELVQEVSVSLDEQKSRCEDDVTRSA